MRLKNFIQPIIGTEKFILDDVSVSSDKSIITLNVHLPKSEQLRCGFCHRKSKRYDTGSEERLWRALDVASSKCMILAACPRVTCKEHGVVASFVPWAGHNARFTYNFEEQVTWLTTHSSKTVVSQLMRIEWHTVGNVCARVSERLQAKAPSPYNNLVNIGIDETSYKKGHKYLTVVVNHDTNAVVWVGVGYGKAVLAQFFELLTEEQRASICCVTADGARWIASCIASYLPNAERCVDPFHVVSWATEVLDKERLEKKGVKKMKYVLLKNPEHLSEAQRAQLDLLVEADPKLHRTYLLKEGLRLALKETPDNIEAALDKWLAWAQRCRIPAFRELRVKIKRHYQAIVATSRHGLSNARIEATNNKIKLVIRMAYGFRNMDNLVAMIMLKCANLPVRLPGR